MENLGQCIRAWMTAQEMDVAELTERLGFKSKTSVYRLLNGQSNDQSCQQFCAWVMPSLSGEWRSRFARAMLVERVGPDRYTLLEALYRQLFEADQAESALQTAHLPAHLSDRGDLTLLGCPWDAAFDLADTLLARHPENRVTQYMTERELLENPRLIAHLMRHMTAQRYQAVLVEERAVQREGVTWNTAFHIAPERAHMMLACGEKRSWHGISAGAWHGLARTLEALPQTPLYRYDDLKSGSDFIDFTEKCFQLEHNRRALVLKPTPGMQMLPADAGKSAFSDFLMQTWEPISTVQDTLVYIYEKRARNFYQRKKATGMMLSLEAMERFVETGLLADHFFAMRPYTPEERRRSLLALREFSHRREVSLRFREGPAWPVSVEAYDGGGVLLYPSGANYNGERTDYRELFLPGQAVCDLFFQLGREMAAFTAEAPNPEQVFEGLLRAIQQQKEEGATLLPFTNC